MTRREPRRRNELGATRDRESVRADDFDREVEAIDRERQLDIRAPRRRWMIVAEALADIRDERRRRKRATAQDRLDVGGAGLILLARDESALAHRHETRYASAGTERAGSRRRCDESGQVRDVRLAR